MSRAIITSAVVALVKRRRGYSTVAAAAAKAPSEGLKKVDATASSASTSPLAYSGSSSWVPDPVTGCYRPTNQSGGVDAAAATRDSPLSKQQKSRG